MKWGLIPGPMSTPSHEGKDEQAAPAKDGELLPRSLDSGVTPVLYRSLPRTRLQDDKGGPAKKAPEPHS
jgi:hypothetical protein